MSIVVNKNKHKPSLATKFGQHFSTIKLTLTELLQAPMASLMTILVLAISLTLPGVLYVLANNAKVVTNNWQSSQQLTVYLKAELSSASTDRVLTELKKHPKIAEFEYISPEQGLQEFKQNSGMGSLLAKLEDNPLPGVAVVQPTASLTTPKSLARLQKDLQKIAGIDFVRLDVQWLTKLESMIALVEQFTIIIAGLLLIAAWLVIANTMRLAIVSRRSEIEVMKLVGATDSFVRRPFIYRGCWLTLVAGLLAWLMINLVTAVIQQKLDPILELYQIQYALKGLAATELIELLMITLLLGWFASTSSVSKHIKQFEPR